MRPPQLRRKYLYRLEILRRSLRASMRPPQLRRKYWCDGNFLSELTSFNEAAAIAAEILQRAYRRNWRRGIASMRPPQLRRKYIMTANRSPLGIVGFNEAAAIAAEILSKKCWVKGQKPGFNEAAAIAAEILTSSISLSSVNLRFNEAAAIAAEILRARTLTNGGHYALQ